VRTTLSDRFSKVQFLVDGSSKWCFKCWDDQLKQDVAVMLLKDSDVERRARSQQQLVSELLALTTESKQTKPDPEQVRKAFFDKLQAADATRQDSEHRTLALEVKELDAWFQLSRLQLPTLVRLHGTFVFAPEAAGSESVWTHSVYSTRRDICIVSELCEGGDLETEVQRLKSAGLPLSEPRAMKLMRCMARAVANMHAEGFLHNDIALRNFFMDRKESDECKLGDFGHESGLEQMANRPVRPKTVKALLARQWLRLQTTAKPPSLTASGQTFMPSRSASCTDVGASCAFRLSS
jgi:serine/threonine protein kinase